LERVRFIYRHSIRPDKNRIPIIIVLSQFTTAVFDGGDDRAPLDVQVRTFSAPLAGLYWSEEDLAAFFVFFAAGQMSGSSQICNINPTTLLHLRIPMRDLRLPVLRPLDLPPARCIHSLVFNSPIPKFGFDVASFSFLVFSLNQMTRLGTHQHQDRKEDASSLVAS
jgi:hypothetical protein